MIALAYAFVFALAVVQYRTARRQTARFKTMECAFQENAARLDTTLAHMDQGLMMVDSAGTIVVCNARVRALLGLPDALPIIQRSFDDLVRYQWDKQEFLRTDITMYDFLRMGGIERAPPIYERLRPDGTVLEIRTTALEDGGYVRTYTDITSRRMAEAGVREQAATDDLTGLANRPTFRRHLQAALKLHATANQAFALLYLDLDRFKVVNDTKGHLVGDCLLVSVAMRLQGQARSTDTVARLGGDEFAILLHGVDAETAGVLADRMIVAVGAPYIINGVDLNIGVSIGIAVSEQPGILPDILLKQADAALYTAKRNGGSTWCLHVENVTGI